MIEQVRTEGKTDRFIKVEWVLKDQAVKSKHYRGVLLKLRKTVRKKRWNLWKNDSWIRHQNNVPVHDCETMVSEQADSCVFEYLPHLPDIAPIDLYLLPKLRSALKGTYFQFVEDIKAKTAKLFKIVTSDEL